MSVPATPPSDLNVFKHSVLFMFHTLIVPSELALHITALLGCHSSTDRLISQPERHQDIEQTGRDNGHSRYNTADVFTF